MQEVTLTRKFKYNGIELLDPSVGLSPDAVREFYAPQYPELLNAVVEGPVTKDGVSTFTFMRAAGDKGRTAEVNLSVKEVVNAIANGTFVSETSGVMPGQLEQQRAEQFAAAFSDVCTSPRPGRAIPMPVAAYGIWG